MHATSSRVRFDHEFTLRPMHGNAGFERALLRHFREQEWEGAPRLYGRDHENRLIHGVLRGTAVHDDRHLPDEYLEEAGALVREFHDLTANTRLAGNWEVVCHNQLAPRHTISQKGIPYAFVDWEAAAPGVRLHDVADLCWRFVDLGPGAEDPFRRVRLICDAYGLEERQSLIETIMARQDRYRRIVESGAHRGDPRMLAQYQDGEAEQVGHRLMWIHEHRRDLAAELTS